MTAERAIRFLEHEARACRSRDAHEALCLLVPALVRLLDLSRMDDAEAAAVRYQVKQELSELNDLVHPARI